MVAELHEGDRAFTVEEVRANVELAVQEHPRLSEIVSDAGLWTKVKIDLAHHIVSLPAEDGKVCGEAVVEEPSNIRNAFADMPALRAEGRPLWQVIITPRKIVLDIHHGFVDGVGMAVIAATILQGKTLAEINAEMCAKVCTQPGAKGCFTGCLEGLKASGIIWWHLVTPLLGIFAPEPKSAVFAKGQPARKNARLMHLGPYKLESLKRASVSRGKLNSVLVHTISQGVHAYCQAEDGAAAALPRRIAVPVNFKRPSAGDPSRIHANNDFSTIAVAVPPQRTLPSELLPQVSASEALAARTAQKLLSLLPLPVIRWLYNTSSRVFSFALSNVNASWAGSQFSIFGSSSFFAGEPQRIRVYGYGAAPADISLFIVVNSHGPDIHIGVTAGCQIRDAEALCRAIDQEICQVMSASHQDLTTCPLLP